MSQAKLVRDRIPQIIRDAGGEPVTRVADAEEYRALLRAKLVEEVEEFLASEDPNELADVLEVLLALAVDLGVDRDRLEKLRTAKTFERGGFAGRIVWSGNSQALEGRSESRPRAIQSAALIMWNRVVVTATSPVQPVWWLAPTPAPLSPWKYS
jgi:predicted house-cleaning noncanonical NTP pyrophosphatase (MazG superfamily)